MGDLPDARYNLTWHQGAPQWGKTVKKEKSKEQKKFQRAKRTELHPVYCAFAHRRAWFQAKFNWSQDHE